MIQFAEERLTPELLEEVLPILHEHYAEIAWKQDKIRFDPDFSAYLQLQGINRVRAYSARDEEGVLCGYAVFLLSPSLHYRSTKYAHNDIIYIRKGLRGQAAGVGLIAFAEHKLQEEGTQVVGFHIKETQDWGPLAARLGYEKVETLWSKWIGD